jgi:ribonuclease-3
MTVEPLDTIQQAIGHSFEDPALLSMAMLHRSHAAEHALGDSYERLEFLGDAVLQLSVTDYLYEEYPAMPEGEMAKVRAAVVNERSLAQLARRWGLGDALRLGRGEELTGGREKESILSDAVEAVLGAVYLDAGFETVRRLILRHWSDLVDERATSPGRLDYKTRLQERLARLGLRPRYAVEEDGPEHAKEFTAKVWANGELLGEGSGRSKKRAEQDAARAASEALDATGDA